MSATPPRPAVLFDLGGVLVDWNPRHLYLKERGPAWTERFLAEVCTASWNLGLDAGKPFAQGIAEKQAEWPQFREEIGWWRSRWDEMLKGPIQATVDLLDDLRARGTDLHALTNWSAETFPLARARFGFLAWFRSIVVSGEVGLVKPDPAVYELARRGIGRAPDGILFIDDAEANVAAAARLGFDAVRFTGAAALRRELSRRGLVD